MAKKVRRVKKKTQNKSAQKPTDQVVLTEGKAPVNISAEQPLSSTDQFRIEYSYVVKDLRRVFVLAAAMFTLLIVLNVLLQ